MNFLQWLFSIRKTEGKCLSSFRIENIGEIPSVFLFHLSAGPKTMCENYNLGNLSGL